MDRRGSCQHLLSIGRALRHRQATWSDERDDVDAGTGSSATAFTVVGGCDSAVLPNEAA